MNVNYNEQYGNEIRSWILDVVAAARLLAKMGLVRRVCPVCGSGGAQFVNNCTLHYERCTGCSLIFQNPCIPQDRVEDGFRGRDTLLAKYFRIAEKYKSEIPPRPDPATDSKLRDIHAIASQGRLLDIGCSIGEFLHKAKHFYDVEGVEINPATAAVAARYFKVHTDTLGRLQLPEAYDIVTLHQILYSVVSPPALFAEIRRVLGPGGLLYVNTPNADSYAMQLYGGRANHLYGYMTLNVFNRRSLETLAACTGFELVSYRTEWLDIYVSDLQVLLDDPDSFVHKKNSHLPGYAARIRAEDECQSRLGLNLGDRGNYLVAVLRKSGAPACGR